MTAEVLMSKETYGVAMDALTSSHLRLEEQLNCRGISRRHEKALREEQLRVTLAISQLPEHEQMRRSWLDSIVQVGESAGARVPESAGAQA